MKRINYVLMFALFMLVTPIMVSADCSNERLAELSKIAGNVQFSYSYAYDDDEVIRFSVNAINIADDIYIQESENRIISKGNEFNYNYNTGGTTKKYNIYSKDPNCYGYNLLTSYVTLPYYNDLSELDYCDYYPEFKYCQKWFNTENVTIDQFNDEISVYIDDIINKQDDTTSEENTGSLLMKFFNENKLFVIITLISLLLLPLLFYVKRRMKI